MTDIADAFNKIQSDGLDSLRFVLDSRASHGWFTSMSDENPTPKPPRDYMAEALRELEEFLKR